MTQSFFKRGLVIAGLVFLLDQVSKFWILEIFDLEAKQSVELLPFFSLTMVWNKGVSMGLMAADTNTARWILVGLTLIISALVVVWLRRATHWLGALGLAMVLGGAIGNIIDRIRFGAVADFLHFYSFGYSFYVFNVADSAITVGVGLLLLEAFITPSQKAEQKNNR